MSHDNHPSNDVERKAAKAGIEKPSSLTERLLAAAAARIKKAEGPVYLRNRNNTAQLMLARAEDVGFGVEYYIGLQTFNHGTMRYVSLIFDGSSSRLIGYSGFTESTAQYEKASMGAAFIESQGFLRKSQSGKEIEFAKHQGAVMQRAAEMAESSYDPKQPLFRPGICAKVLI